MIRVKKAGTIKVEMATAASANYEAAEAVEAVEATLVVRPGTVRSAGVQASVAYADGLTYDAAKLFDLDKNAGAATYAVSGPAKLGADGHTIEVTGTGIVTVTANTAASADGNWAAGAVEAKLTVSDGSLATGVMVTPYVGTYDGTSHDAVKVEAPADATVSYALNDGTWTTVAPQLTDAGEYTVKVRVEKANFEAYETTVTASIAKATVDMSGVTFADATVTYDGTEHALEVTGELPEGITGVSYENNTLTHAGATQATATFSADANHEVPAPMTATLTVARAAQQIAADKAELSLKTGEKTQVKLTGVADGAVVTWASSDPEVATVAADGTVTALKAGTVTLTASASATADFEASNTVEVKLTVTDASAGDEDDKKGDDKELPQTGDASLVAPAVAGASGILAALGGLLARRRHRS